MHLALLLPVFLVLASLPEAHPFVDCRTSCHKCRQGGEASDILEVYCSMCKECRDRRRNKANAPLPGDVHPAGLLGEHGRRGKPFKGNRAQGHPGGPISRAGSPLGGPGRPLPMGRRPMPGRHGPGPGLGPGGRPMAGRHLRRPGRLLGPAGRPLGRTRRPLGPAGRPLGQAGQPLGPAHLLGPAGRPLGPLGKPFGHGGRPVGPVGRPLALAGRPFSNARRPPGPVGRLHGAAGRPMEPVAPGGIRPAHRPLLRGGGPEMMGHQVPSARKPGVRAPIPTQPPPPPTHQQPHTITTTTAPPPSKPSTTPQTPIQTTTTPKPRKFKKFNKLQQPLGPKLDLKEAESIIDPNHKYNVISLNGHLQTVEPLPPLDQLRPLNIGDQIIYLHEALTVRPSNCPSPPPNCEEITEKVLLLAVTTTTTTTTAAPAHHDPTLVSSQPNPQPSTCPPIKCHQKVEKKQCCPSCQTGNSCPNMKIQASPPQPPPPPPPPQMMMNPPEHPMMPPMMMPQMMPFMMPNINMMPPPPQPPCMGMGGCNGYNQEQANPHTLVTNQPSTSTMQTPSQPGEDHYPEEHISPEDHEVERALSTASHPASPGVQDHYDEDYTGYTGPVTITESLRSRHDDDYYYLYVGVPKDSVHDFKHSLLNVGIASNI